MVICTSSRLFAAYHVLLRLREPRHPLCALVSFLYEILSPRLPGLTLFYLLLVIFTLLTFQYVNVLFFRVVLGRVELPTSTLSV